MEHLEFFPLLSGPRWFSPTAPPCCLLPYYPRQQPRLYKALSIGWQQWFSGVHCESRCQGLIFSGPCAEMLATHINEFLCSFQPTMIPSFLFLFFLQGSLLFEIRTQHMSCLLGTSLYLIHPGLCLINAV